MVDQTSYLKHEDYQEIAPHSDDNQSNFEFHHHDHDHGHTHSRITNSKILFVCLIITFIFSGVEATGGYFTHSVTLLSDALHMLTDSVGLLIAYIANNISKKPATTYLTFGYGKAEAIGALVNCTFTLALTCGLILEIIQRFFVPVAVHGKWVFIIAIIGFLTNGIIAWILSKSHESLNTKSALIHALGDMFASFVAILAGIIIYFTHLSIADSLLSMVVVIVLIVSNYKLIRRSTYVLMSGVPENLDYIAIGKDIEAIDGVIGVHDLHVWYMSANIPALSAHIVARDLHSWHKTLAACQTMLANKHHISHVTLQHEFDPFPEINFCEIR